MNEIRGMLRRASIVVLAVSSGLAVARADEPASLAPEARLALEIARGNIIRGIGVEPYVDLLQEGSVEEWNKRRAADGFKVLDLAGKTWDTRGREDLVLKLEGKDLRGIDLSRVIFPLGTSFRFSDLSGASFKGACLEGVQFSGLHDFTARDLERVAATNLAGADFRDVVWGWCLALERTVRRAFPEPGRNPHEPQKQKQDEARNRLIAALQRQGGGASHPFTYAMTEGMKLDADSPWKSVVDAEDPRRPRSLEKLMKAAIEGTLERAIDKLLARGRAAKVRSCPNPLAAEPALAAAIAAVRSDLTGIETWSAVTLAEPALREEVYVEGARTLLVLSDARSQSIPLIAARGPVLAWRRAAVPTTFSASAVILKDQVRAAGVVHGSPVFAFADTLRPDARHRSYGHETAGTFHAQVVIEAPNVENLSEAEVDRRTLQEQKLEDYAAMMGDHLDGRSWDPSADAKGIAPEKGLSATVRKSLLAELGAAGLSDMRVIELKKRPANATPYVHSKDPKAIIVVSPGFNGVAAIYAQGPVVFLDGPNRGWFSRCVSKSWIGIQGDLRVSQMAQLGKKIDVEREPAEKEKKDDD